MRTYSYEAKINHINFDAQTKKSFKSHEATSFHRSMHHVQMVNQFEQKSFSQIVELCFSTSIAKVFIDCIAKMPSILRFKPSSNFILLLLRPLHSTGLDWLDYRANLTYPF